MDGTEDELPYEKEAEVDSPDSDWDPHYDETVNDDHPIRDFTNGCIMMMFTVHC